MHRWTSASASSALPSGRPAIPSYVYQINQRSLQRAAEAGISGDRIITFLNPLTRQIPPKVVAALQRYAKPVSVSAFAFAQKFWFTKAMSTTIGKIVKSNSHIDYVCQVYGQGEFAPVPDAADYAFGSFVAIDSEDADEGRPASLWASSTTRCSSILISATWARA